jgi:hypothetical protein
VVATVWNAGPRRNIGGTPRRAWSSRSRALRQVELADQLETDAGDEQLATWLKLTERYRVVLQTIRAATPATAVMERAAVAWPAPAPDLRAWSRPVCRKGGEGEGEPAARPRIVR